MAIVLLEKGTKSYDLKARMLMNSVYYVISTDVYFCISSCYADIIVQAFPLLTMSQCGSVCALSLAITTETSTTSAGLVQVSLPPLVGTMPSEYSDRFVWGTVLLFR